MTPDSTFIKFLVEAIPSLGMGAIFLYLYLKERKTNAIMTENLMTAYKEQVAAQLGMMHAIENITKALEDNTNVVRALGRSG